MTRERSVKQAQATAHDNGAVHEEDIEGETLPDPVDAELEEAVDMRELLTINLNMFHPHIELRRLIGADVLAAQGAEQTQGDRARTRRSRGQLGTTVRRRHPVLVPMRHDFPLTIHGGLSMRQTDDLDGVKQFKFVHCYAYRESQRLYLSAVERDDAQTLSTVHATSPFHVETLLELSKRARRLGQNGASFNCLTRALYAFDRAFLPLFDLASGMVRLPFRYPENRPFCLVICQYMQSLERKNRWATAFEFNKLLYAMAPEEDPCAALLSIDYCALSRVST